MQSVQKYNCMDSLYMYKFVILYFLRIFILKMFKSPRKYTMIYHHSQDSHHNLPPLVPYGYPWAFQ